MFLSVAESSFFCPLYAVWNGQKLVYVNRREFTVDTSHLLGVETCSHKSQVAFRSAGVGITGLKVDLFGTFHSFLIGFSVPPWVSLVFEGGPPGFFQLVSQTKKRRCRKLRLLPFWVFNFLHTQNYSLAGILENSSLTAPLNMLHRSVIACIRDRVRPEINLDLREMSMWFRCRETDCGNPLPCFAITFWKHSFTRITDMQCNL